MYAIRSYYEGSGTGEEDLDFASVQRGNPEMQRRAQEVIDSCWTLGEHNPILSIHDIGAGGLSNAVPEIVDQSERGVRVALRAVPSDEPGMTPMELWCNESQDVITSYSIHYTKLYEDRYRWRRPEMAARANLRAQLVLPGKDDGE